MRPFPKFTHFFCLTKDNLAVTFVNIFIECVFFYRVFKENTFFLFLTNKQDLFQQICLYLGPSSVVNRNNTITLHLTMSKGLIENQTGNCVIFTFFSFFLLQIFYIVFYPSYVSICKDRQKTIVLSSGSFLQVFTFTVQYVCNL